MTVGPDGQPPIDDEGNATVGPAGPTPTPNLDRTLDRSPPADPDSGQQSRSASKDDKPTEDHPQGTVGPEDQTLHLDHTFDRSLPPDSATRKKENDNDDNATDQTFDYKDPEKHAASEGPKSVLQTAAWIAKQPGTSAQKGELAAAADEAAPETADDSFDRSYPIGRYEVRRLLGQGAFGRVYEAHDPQLDRRVAVKVSKDLKGRDEVNRFLREARSAAHLRHPTIIPVFEYGQIDDMSMIVYELVDGETLRSYIKRHAPLELSNTISIIRKIAEGLDYAHKQGIIHRDVKPDNVLMDKQGEPHIADFGCARRSDDQDMHQTIEGSILGTPMYMSPEQASGQSHRADGRSDVWSLGVMLYEMVSGQKPFDGKLSDLLHLIRHHDAKPLRKVHADTPRDIETICARCLHRDLDKRFATAGELADELGRYERGEPILSRRISLLNRTWLWAKRNRAVASLLTAVAITLLAGTTFSTYFAIKAYIEQKKRAETALSQLTTAESSSLDGILVDLEESENTMLKNIRQQLEESDLSEQERRRLTLGRLHLGKDGEKQRPDLFTDDLIQKSLLSADGYELISFCKSLSESEKLDLQERLWKIFLDKNATNDHHLRAACALAQIDPQADNWNEEVARDVAGYLTAMNLLEVPQWLKTVEPVRQKIKPKLKAQFDASRTRDYRTLEDASPETAALILSYMLKDYAPDLDGDGQLSPKENDLAAAELTYLVDLVPRADARQLGHLMAVLETQAFRDPAKKLLIEQLQKEPDATVPNSDELVSEKANLIVALIRMDYPEAWQRLRRSGDNSVSTEVIELLGTASTSVDLLLKKIDELKATSSNPDALAVAILALGQYTEGQIPQTRRDDILQIHLLEIFRNHGNARVHSSARWLMTEWGSDGTVEKEEVKLRRELPAPGKNWHVDMTGNTFVVFGPEEFDMGEGKLSHRRSIPRRFGICIHETTAKQFAQFLSEMLVQKETQLELLAESGDARSLKKLDVEIKRLRKRIEKLTNMDKDRPVADVDFFRSLAYCRWLSEQERLNPSVPKIQRLQTFYDEGDGMRYDAIDLEKPGYRLPTAGEWEIACRAGTNTIRSFGIDDERLREYAWFASNSDNSPQSAAKLKPNEAGLFDMLGNVSELCLDWFHLDLSPKWQSGEVNPWIDFTDNRQSPTREYRGGSYDKELIEVQTTYRFGTNAKKGFRYLGFRIARTYPPADRTDSSVSLDQ